MRFMRAPRFAGVSHHFVGAGLVGDGSENTREMAFDFYSREASFDTLASGGEFYGYEQTQFPYARYTSRRQSFGFEVIPEEVAVTHGEGGVQLGSQRQADAAVLSWRVGGAASTSWTSGLSLSARSSDIDLKAFLVHRGNRPLEGLHRAAATGDRAGIMHLMKLQGPGGAIDDLDSNGCSPLMYAVMADSRLAIEMLLNFGARRDQTDAEGRTAVHYAAFFGKHRSLKFLIEAASDWTPRDIYGRTPLHWACCSKNTKAIQVLLKHAGVVLGNITPRDNEGMTPLHCAAHFCRPKHIALMNEGECDFSATDMEGKTALHWTVSNPDGSCIEALVDAYPSLLNKKDANGSTILHLTTSSGSTHLVDALLKIEGIDIDAKDNMERTALHCGCMESRSEIVQLLLEARALDSCIDTHGLTALHYAVQSNSPASIHAFVQLPEVTHLPDNEGRTPLVTAALNGFDQIVKILLKNAAVAMSINHVDSNSRSALHLAAQAGSAGCVSVLLSNGADPNLLDGLQQSALFPASEGGYPGCIHALIAGECQPNTLDVDAQAPLHKAVLYGRPEAVQALVIAGADLNITDGTGSTALHLAAYAGNDGTLSILLENSADPNVQDLNGMSAVHLAAVEGNANCLTVLLHYRAYPSFMDFSDERHTPLDYARFHGHDTCADILANSGGVSTQAIREMAAISIQTAYRGYRARVLRSNLAVLSHAVTLIAAHFRSYRQRMHYKEMKRRHYAAIKMQAHVRGYLQRTKFRGQLARYREQENNRNLMEDFSKRVLDNKESMILHIFTTKMAQPVAIHGTQELETLVEEPDMEEQAKQQKMRLEGAMQMREIYEEKQKRWQLFREAEKQRRIDKANQEELDRLAGILAQSRARRQYSESRFYHTRTMKSHYESAVVLQRAFRRMKQTRAWQRKLAMEEEAQKRERESKAACVIQKAWKRYKQQKLYEALHFRAILTSPVIALRDHVAPTYKKVETTENSYQRSISITGNPRRKVHQTEQSGFKVFRPTTRDLLTQGAVITRGKPNRPVSTLTTPIGIESISNEVRALLIRKSKSVPGPEQPQLLTSMTRAQRKSDGRVLPLLLQSPTSEKPRRSAQPILHLPHIVSPSKTYQEVMSPTKGHS